jgi:hypothetical protein
VHEVTTGTKHDILLPNGCTVSELRKLIAKQLQLPADRLRLVHKGATLWDGRDAPILTDADTVLAFVSPNIQTAKPSDRHGAPETAEDDERFRLRPGASWLERAAAQWLRRHRVPDLFMQLLVWLLRPSILIGTALWFAGAPVAAHFSVGPLYVLGTMLALILTNLGTRKAGELSAYSIFNPGARQLPGQLNADAIDQQIRAGNI